MVERGERALESMYHLRLKSNSASILSACGLGGEPGMMFANSWQRVETNDISEIQYTLEVHGSFWRHRGGILQVKYGVVIEMKTMQMIRDFEPTAKWTNTTPLSGFHYLPMIPSHTGTGRENPVCD